MRSKILLAIAVLAAVAGVLCASAAEAVSDGDAEAFEVDGLKYEINEDNDTVTLTGYNEETFDPSKGLTVASTVEHEGKAYRVTAIGERAFEECTGLDGLVLNEGLEAIGDFAFWDCSGLTGTLSIPSTVTAIGEGAFGYCSGLTGTFTIPRGVTHIGERPCTYAGFTSIVVEEGNENYIVEDGILFDDEKTMLIQTTANTVLSDYIVPNTVTKICKSAFYECTSLTGTLTIPNSVLSIGNHAFDGCTGLTGTLTIPSTVTDIGEAAFQNCAGLEGLTLNEGLTTIGQYAFFGCTGLEGLTLNEGLTTIGKHAFYGCTGLTGALTIPSTVTTIGDCALAGIGCSGIEVAPGNEGFASEDGILFSKDMTTLIQVPAGKELADYTVPGSVTAIGSGAFFGCIKLSSLNLHSGIKTIGHHIIYGCTGLSGTLIIPSSVEKIERFAFSNSGYSDIKVDDGNENYASKDGILFSKDMTTLILAMTRVELVDYTMPSTVTTLANSAFYGCENVKGTITIGSNVKSIEAWAFYKCTGITGFVIASGVEGIGEYAFMGWSFYDVDGTTPIDDPSDLPGFTYKGTMEKMVRQEASHESSYNIWLIVGAVVAVLIIVAVAIVLVKRKP